MTPTEFYRAERDEADREAARTAVVARRLSWLRLVLLALVTASVLASGRLSPALAIVFGTVSVIAFIAAIARHRTIQAHERAARSRSRACGDGLARIERRWADLPSSSVVPDATTWPGRVARDLGVVGDRSLMQLLGAPRSALGAHRLLQWLLDDPASIEVIARRQHSVQSLREHGPLLLDIAANAERGSENAQTARAIAAFVAWCEGGPPAASKVSVGRALSVGLLALGIAGAGSRTEIGTLVIGVAITGQLVLCGRARFRINASAKGIETALSQLEGLVRITDVVTGAPDADGRFGEIQRDLRKARVTDSVRSLVRLLSWNDVRYSPLAHWIANAAVGFDVHLEAAMESTKGRHRTLARAWIDELSDALALASLSTLAFEHPEWIVPRFGDGEPLAASALAHPLLAADSAVANDATLAAPAATVIVSGPNMAGKTTFLRAVGVNLLLAQAGGVVRAAKMNLARCRIRSSIRVEDDLGQGISLFLAEILRARDIVADAEDRAAAHVMFLFDEILHGTNAEDRRLATRAVLERLQRAGAVGIVTTHDPGIATGTAEHIHFDAEISRGDDGRPTLRFDYRATPGPAVRTNALALVELYLTS
jgi:predicted ATPase